MQQAIGKITRFQGWRDASLLWLMKLYAYIIIVFMKTIASLWRGIPEESPIGTDVALEARPFPRWRDLQGACSSHPLCGWLLTCLFIFIFAPQTVWGQGLLNGDYIDFEFFVNDRFNYINNFFNTHKKKFNQDRILHILYLNSSVTALLYPHVLGVLELEADFVFDLERHETEDEFDVRNAYIQTALPGWDWLTLSVGRQAFSTANGLIYDDEDPAVKIASDLERGFGWPVKLHMIAAEIENDSPYIHAELKYIFSFLESVTFHYGWFRDTNDGVAKIFNYIEGETLYKSRGHMQWFGFSLKKFLGNALLRTSFIYEHGSVRLKHKRTGSTSMSMRAYLLDINFDYSFTDDLSASLFFFVSSGDNRPQKGTLRSFISIDPYVDKTNIFFNGGIDSQFSSDNVGLNGVQIPGVITPGVTVDYRAGRNAYFKFIFAYLLTHKGTGSNGHTYGWETDFLGYYNISDNLQLFAELNLFNPGDYFNKLTNHRDHPATELIIGVNYFFER